MRLCNLFLVYKNSPPASGPGSREIANWFAYIPDEDVTAVNIIGHSSCPEDIFDCYGTVQFYQKYGVSFNGQQIGYDSYYLGRASVIGAVFAEDPEHYNCQMRRAFKKLQFIAQIYQDKVNQLYNYYLATGNNNCQMISAALPHLQTIDYYSGLFANDFPSAGILTYIGNIYNAMSQLEIINNQLQRLSCAEIY